MLSKKKKKKILNQNKLTKIKKIEAYIYFIIFKNVQSNQNI